MSFSLKSKDATVADGIRRIASSQIEAAIGEVDDPSLDRAKVVHQVRKRCKKIRGLLRLVRPRLPMYSEENARFRDAARTLSGSRDAEVMVATYDALESHFGRRFDSARFQSVRERLVEERDAANGEGETLDARLADFKAGMIEALEATKSWRIEGNGGEALRAGIRKTQKAGRKALKAAHRDPRAENMHELRKRVKDVWYQTRIMRALWPAPMQALVDELDRLSDILGDGHDLSVFHETLGRLARDGVDPHVCNELATVAGERRRRLEAAALALSDRVFAGDPTADAERVMGLWKAWRRDPTPLAPLDPAKPNKSGKPKKPEKSKKSGKSKKKNGSAGTDDNSEMEREFLVRGEEWGEAVKTT